MTFGEYLRYRFYFRGDTPLGLLNTLLAFLFNRVLVKHTEDLTGKTVGWSIDKGTNFPPYPLGYGYVSGSGTRSSQHDGKPLTPPRVRRTLRYIFIGRRRGDRW